MAMRQVLEYRLNQRLHDLVITHAAQETKRSPTDILIGVDEVIPDSVAHKNHLFLDFAIILDLVADFPIE
jgi:hypothetical protein